MKWGIGFFALLPLQLFAVIPEKVVICTVCRDVGLVLPETIQLVEGVGSLFQDYRVVAYENNSEDDTPSQLYRWKRRNPKVSVWVEFLADTDYDRVIVNRPKGQFSRAEQTALARNKALMMALSEFGEEFSYILWIEPGVQISSLEEIANTFQECQDWDAVFAYRIDADGNFNDWGAFRDSLHPFGPELLGDVWFTGDRQFSLSKEHPWHPVYSAYGGCALYRRDALQGCKYEALVTGDLESVMPNWLFWGLIQGVPFANHYLQDVWKIPTFIYIDSPCPELPEVTSEQCGIHITEEALRVVWKIHSQSLRYPAVCEHLPFHASMHCRGHHKLFINPRLVCVGKGSHCAFRPSQGS